MAKAVRNHTNLNTAVKRALNAKTDYSDVFAEKVHSLAKLVEKELAIPVEHDDDMNYSAAQKIVVWLDVSCHVISPNDSDGKYRLIDYVSSKGPFFAFAVMKLSDTSAEWKEKGLTEPRLYWTTLAEKEVPERIMSLQKKISAVMRSNKYALLERPVLSQETEGRLTELDRKPATVFEVLFSEID